jgi:F-type H+-transporting ATPase subunit a
VSSVVSVAGSFLAANISVGLHPEVKTFFGTLDADTLWGTGAAVVVVVLLALAVRKTATAGVPGKFQLVWEMAVEAIRKQVQGSTDTTVPLSPVVPLAVSLFLFILIANWFSVFGLGSTYEWLSPPTGDINLPLALAIIVIVPVHIASIVKRGPIGYVRHYVAQPFPIFLFPLNIFMNGVEEIAKPLTLALRLFGNMLSGGLMLALIASLAAWNLVHVPIGYVFTLALNPVWKGFDLGIGAIQAFIFTLLMILYFDTATRTEGH